MTRTVATRCQILRQNCTKLDFGWALTQTHWESFILITALSKAPS